MYESIKVGTHRVKRAQGFMSGVERVSFRLCALISIVLYIAINFAGPYLNVMLISVGILLTAVAYLIFEEAEERAVRFARRREMARRISEIRDR